MLFRKLLPLRTSLPLLLSFAFFGAAAHAQLAVYGTYKGERLTGFTCLDPRGQCAATGGIVHPYGVNFGGYYDFRNVGPVRFGLDLRGDVEASSKSAQAFQASSGLIRRYAALAGIRASLASPIKYIRPYVEGAGGYAKTNAAGYSVVTGVSSYSNYGEAEGLIGLDVPILPYLDIRAVELGAGAIFGSSTHGFETVGAGLVFHSVR